MTTTTVVISDRNTQGKAGPLAGCLDILSTELRAKRYASETIRIYLAAAKAFGRWLSRHQLGIDDVSESVLQRYVANLKRLQKHPLTPYGRRPRLRTSFSGRQHLTALERDGMVIKGETQSSGGRPEQLFGLTTAGHELF